MPVDPERSSRGNILLVHYRVYDEPQAHVQTKAQLEELRREHAYNLERGIIDEPELLLYVHHRATCPKRNEWRDQDIRRKQAAARTGEA